MKRGPAEDRTKPETIVVEGGDEASLIRVRIEVEFQPENLPVPVSCGHFTASENANRRTRALASVFRPAAQQAWEEIRARVRQAAADLTEPAPPPQPPRPPADTAVFH